jgi:DmsE family decaheme c-type cytochrome
MRERLSRAVRRASGGTVSHRLCLAALCLFAATISARATGLIFPVPIEATQAAPATKPSPPQAATPQAAPGDYAGTDTCVVCHTDQEKSLQGTQHAQAKNPRTPMAGHGCESCHGPGKAHAEDDAGLKIAKIKEMSPAAQSQTCLTCHNRGNHAGWEGSGHERRNLSCTTCHSVHSPKSFERQLVKANETAVCAQCHRVQVAKTERAVAHMPVREGKMACSSCHNPHGSINNVKALKAGTSVSESCMTCHTEMRAPVLWEHAPVKENCATCHDPHGSSNDRMLAVRMPMLCQRCHVATRHPASIYDNNAITVNKSNRMFGRSCVNCHSNVHGSNHPSGQFYMR